MGIVKVFFLRYSFTFECVVKIFNKTVQGYFFLVKMIGRVILSLHREGKEKAGIWFI